jgi:RHS repeat-associated protein
MNDDPRKSSSLQSGSSPKNPSLQPGEKPQQDTAAGSVASADNQLNIPKVELPRGGGALKSIDEKFQVNAANGSASFTVPLPLPKARSAFMPNVTLGYNSGSGNGAFGLGWNLSQVFIQRKTDKLLPQYQDAGESDVFLLSGAEDLVPAMVADSTGQHWTLDEFVLPTGEHIKRYRPRIEAGFSRIEKITPPGAKASYWKVTTADNLATIYGRNAAARVIDPSAPDRVFRWLPELSYDDKGNCLEYEYLAEDFRNVPNLLHERNRLSGLAPCTNTYLKRIRYGNKTPYYPAPDHPYDPGLPSSPDYFFAVVLDYGDHDPDVPTPGPQRDWPCRLDPFSNHKSGFEIRTYRLCRRILFFNFFKELNDGITPAPCLVRSLDLSYRYFNNPAISPSELRNVEVDYPIAVTQTSYRKNGSGYDKASVPSLDLTYQELAWNNAVQTIAREDLVNAPAGLSAGYQWVDLLSEGIAGILSEQGDGWFYKTNLGAGAFSAAELVTPKPSFVGIGKRSLSIQELEADGRKFVVSTQAPLQGYWEFSDDEEWQPFRAFARVSIADAADPNAKFIDLNGDGRPELVISEENVFTWYRSEGTDGYDRPDRAFKPFDEEKGPALVFADATNSIFLSDMTGDGLTDLVRIRNGEVCYWPNQGYGRFGAKVTMNFAPVFDTADAFNPAYIHLADVSGTGANDILYLGKNRFRAWLNQAGNAWSQETEINPFPGTEQPNQIAVVDLLGNGTSCIVWSSPLPNYADRPMRYVDLMGGKKPYIILGYKNNLGKEVAWEYKSSTHYYLQDKKAGKRWVTKLAFPVQCVSKVSHIDRVTRAYLSNQYVYHHGYYDHAEREYRGFGMVEQIDTETFDQFVKNSASGVVDEPLQQAPVLTKTWFHTGAFFQQGDLLTRFRLEYFQNPSVAEHHLLLPELPAAIAAAQERREAARACKGMTIRQEIYALDGLPGISETPYTVAERNCKIQMPQPLGGNRHAVFLVTESETITYNYERDRTDPRIGHTLHTEIDEYGNILQSASVGYPRRPGTAGLPAKVDEEQQKLHITYSLHDYTGDQIAPAVYRLRHPYQSREFELTGVTPTASCFDLAELAGLFGAAATINYEDAPDGSAQKRRLHHSRTLFLKDDLSGPLPLAQMDPLGLTHETYSLAFTASLLTSLYGTRATPAMLAEGKYLRSNDYKTTGLFPSSDNDDEWWIPSGQVRFPANAPDAFYMPDRYLDPFGNVTTVAYYPDYHLAVAQVTDAAGNQTSVESFDWRSVTPQRVKDSNDNIVEIRSDLLGFVVGTAVLGKGAEADDFTGFVTDPTPAEIASFFADPAANGAGLLQHASTRFVYDFSVTPARVGTIMRETHYQDTLSSGIASKLQFSFEYSSGSGAVAMRKVQTKPGLAKQIDASNNVVEVDTTPRLRWIGTGRTVLNNKGNPVKQYHPYFSATNGYEDDPKLVEIGVTPLMHYDPPGRLVRTDMPDGSFSSTETGAWLTRAFDANDTVRDSDWFAERTTGSLSGDPRENQAALKAAVHYDTPLAVHMDSLGRQFYSVAHNRFENPATHAVVEQFFETYLTLDIEGQQLAVRDPRGNTVMQHAYDMAGHADASVSMDAGEHQLLNDCSGKPIYNWSIKDGQPQLFHTFYDALHRPTQTRVKQGAAAEILSDQSVYGEGQLNDKANNLRGKLYQHRDQSGLTTNVSWDFKGNLQSTTLQLVSDYQNDIDWNAGPVLETEVFSASTDHDALNRSTRIVAPNSNAAFAHVSVPGYNEAGKLQTMDVYLRGAAAPPRFVSNIDYNELGQRTRIDYANGTSTVYKYDELTLRLIALITARNVDPEIFWDDESKLSAPAFANDVLQYLRYTWDPVGNVTFLRDDAQQVIYFNNAIVDPSCDYTYDATYRLIQALGREHIGQNAPADAFDSFRMGNPQPGDGNQMRAYTQRYDYDAAGNMLLMKNVGGWGRTFTYAATSNRLLTAAPDGATGTPFTYSYDEHGSMKAMPHLPVMDRDFKDELRHLVLSVSATPNQEAWYVYGASGQRVCKVVQKGNLREERLYLGNVERFRRYSGNTLVLERESVHVLDDKRRIAMVDIPTVKPAGNQETQVIRYQYSNHLDTACLEVDDAARIISYEEFYPFGSTSYQAVDQTREVAAKRYRYTGKERDEESGLYYHGARYYAPWLGRWTACDPVGIADHLNVYAYVHCNPIKQSDPDGTFAKTSFDKWLTDEVGKKQTIADNTTKELNGLKTEKTATQDRLAKIDSETQKLQAEKTKVAAARAPLDNKKTKRTAQEEQERKSLIKRNNEIAARMTELSTEKGTLSSKAIRLDEKITLKQAALDNATAALTYINKVKADFDKAYSAATKGLSAEDKSDLQILTDVVMNEAGSNSKAAKEAVASAHLNDKVFHVKAGHLITPSDSGKDGSISHYSETSSGKKFEKDKDKAGYITHFTESLMVAKGRLDKTTPVTDPTGGATRWVSPDALKALGLPIPDWTLRMTTVPQPAGVPAGQFTFYKK